MPLALALALVAGVTQPAVRGATTMGWGVDHDRDGIDDGVEQWAAEYFMPNLRYHSAEDCGGPWYNPVLYRVHQLKRNGVVMPGWAAINYVRLYEADCGSPDHNGIANHPNDNEPFMVIVRFFEGEWRTAELVAFNHAGTAYETHTSTVYEPPLRPSQERPDLYVSRHKHANYTRLSACNRAEFTWPDGCQHTTYDLELPQPIVPHNLRHHTLRNVGEPHTNLMPGEMIGSPGFGFFLSIGIAGHFPQPWGPCWQGHDPWRNVKLCGAGTISDGLYTSKYSYQFGPNVLDDRGMSGRISECQQRAKEGHDQDPTLAFQGIDLARECSLLAGDVGRWDP